MDVMGKAEPRWPLETAAFLALGTLAALGGLSDAGGLAPLALMILLAAGVALTGLPHGALDPWIARRAGLWRGKVGFAVFNLAYLALALAMIGFWSAFPAAGLALFLTVSAWHFGADWFPSGRPIPRAIAGLALLALPGIFHPGTVGALFAILAGPGGEALAALIADAGPLVMAALTGVILLELRRRTRHALELAALAVLAGILDPLIYFLVYFCALHSPRHLRGAFAQAPRNVRARLAGLALTYTLVTIALATLLWPFIADAEPDSALLRLVFIGLAALTVPHLCLVEWARNRAEATPGESRPAPSPSPRTM